MDYFSFMFLIHQIGEGLPVIVAIFGLIIAALASVGKKPIVIVLGGIFTVISLSLLIINTGWGLKEVDGYSDRGFYLGRANNKIAEGKGKFYDKNKNIIYDGEFKNNLYDGKGKLYKVNNTEKSVLYYEGEFVEGKINGKGKQYETSGENTGNLIYEGEFYNEKYNGYGIKYYSEDEFYEGGFVESKKDGFGKWRLITHDGNKTKKEILICGKFSDDLLNGYAEVFVDGELLYKKDFKNKKVSSDMDFDNDEYVATEIIVLKNVIYKLKVGEHQTVSAQVFPQGATYQKIEWCSDDERIVAIDDNGVISALSIGKTKIYGFNGDIKVECDVIVESGNRLINKVSIFSKKNIVLLTDNCVFNKKAQKPHIIVKDNEGQEISSDCYDLSYRNNKNVGRAVIYIKFKNNYIGTIKREFQIKPQGTQIKYILSKQRGLEVKWRKNKTQISGYQIEFCADKKFKKGLIVLNVSKNKITINKLRKERKYYVRIRTYKVVEGKKYYSAWSKTRSAKTR